MQEVGIWEEYRDAKRDIDVSSDLRYCSYFTADSLTEQLHFTLADTVFCSCFMLPAASYCLSYAHTSLAPTICLLQVWGTHRSALFSWPGYLAPVLSLKKGWTFAQWCPILNLRNQKKRAAWCNWGTRLDWVYQNFIPCVYTFNCILKDSSIIL